MKITDELLDYIGILARLHISDEEREKTKQEINKIVEYMDILNELDTTNIEAMSHASLSEMYFVRILCNLL